MLTIEEAGVQSSITILRRTEKLTLSITPYFVLALIFPPRVFGDDVVESVYPFFVPLPFNTFLSFAVTFFSPHISAVKLINIGCLDFPLLQNGRRLSS
jgi:hypothetical protein